MKFIDRLRAWLRDRSSSTERGSSTNGFLSYAGEWHALALGAFFGLVTGLTHMPEVIGFFAAVVIGAKAAPTHHFEDAKKELAYSGGAFVALFLAGTLIRLVTIGF